VLLKRWKNSDYTSSETRTSKRLRSLEKLKEGSMTNMNSREEMSLRKKEKEKNSTGWKD